MSTIDKALLRQLVPSGDIWQLAGPRNAKRRVAAMLAITGQRLPQSKCGVTAIRDALHAIVQPAGNCAAAREDSLRAWFQAD